MPRHPVLPLLAAGLLAAAASSQQDVLRQRLDPATYAALQPILEQASRDSLPLKAIEAKALEGQAKRRPGALIVAAVRQLAADLRAARLALREALPQRAISDGEIVAAAEAVRQGVPGEVITTVAREAQPGAPLEIPLALLGALVSRQVPVQEAANVIAHMLASGIPQERMVEIPQRVDVALRVGAPPVAALGTALQSLGIPVPPAPPARGRPPGIRPPVPDVPDR
ncbi:MAG: hypothetical protein KatS3mg081_0707 [Gemmatimonadales bacterium]|nr:hypothetical protein HRbin33_02564 [bacterium HR33]GIW51352.1 MAG: hypothetical protein KatS3mg081_0707 [Gemmatimonadales bacterium]